MGRTIAFETGRQRFYEPERILDEVRERVRQTTELGETIDYLAFVPDGEPTLDLELGRSIEALKPLGIKIAVICNSSLIDQDEVKLALAPADWVSLKVDSTIEHVWRKIDRPHRSLKLDRILEGMLEFRDMYKGELVTETMLVSGMNDGKENMEAVAAFLSSLKPDKAYLSIPTRPPAEKRVRLPEEGALIRAHQILEKQVGKVEYLIGYEGDAFASTGDAEQDLLSITAVHPMREDAVEKLLAKSGAPRSVVENLVAEDRLIEMEYDGHRFYVRRFSKGKN
ncbi:MAG: radical SAM protein [Spirochaetales bacterium]|nr:radical SAM protein [Spirochaetales bacterium]